MLIWAGERISSDRKTTCFFDFCMTWGFATTWSQLRSAVSWSAALSPGGPFPVCPQTAAAPSASFPNRQNTIEPILSGLSSGKG